VAFNGLGLTQVTDLLGRVLLFLPKVLVALLVLVFGSYFARFVGKAVQVLCRSVGHQRRRIARRASCSTPSSPSCC
jgi:hypothetical protein